MSTFINFETLTVKRAAKPDNVGGYDWAIIDEQGKVIGEAFEIVGKGAMRNAEANARLWSSAASLKAQRDALLAAAKVLVETSRAFAGMHSSAYLSESKYRHDLWESMLSANSETQSAIAACENGQPAQPAKEAQ